VLLHRIIIIEVLYRKFFVCLTNVCTTTIIVLKTARTARSWSTVELELTILSAILCRLRIFYFYHHMKLILSPDEEKQKKTSHRYFTHILPVSRLGERHASKESFLKTVYGGDHNVKNTGRNSTTEYTLVVVTECSSTSQRILLGLKLRGFGMGFYNSFGGKLDPSDESIVRGAIRELMEEANICIQSEDLLKHVGQLSFSFEEDTQEDMLIHLFHLHNYFADSCTSNTSLVVRGCDEIEPKWFDSWQDIPFHQMFADDSIWLPIILDFADSEKRDTEKIGMDGYFHFARGGTATNTILHYYITLRGEQTENNRKKNID
jgi:8-oxo-dGTP pyrophosphatase MutT (NUDIX family)